MNKLGLLVAGALTAGAATATHYVTRDSHDTREAPPAAADSTAVVNMNADTPAYTPDVLRQSQSASAADVEKLYTQAAQRAWAYLDKGYVAETGLVMAQPEWPYPTLWDVASTLGAYYSAHGLGLITEAEYLMRTTLALETLKRAELYDNVAYGRNYDARTGKLIGAGHEAAGDGIGYSAIDLGRLLVWLKIVGQSNSALAGLASDVAGRLKAARIVRNGYLQGETLPKTGKLMVYQEGRIGYEQYAAKGFQLWGFKADRAANLHSNAATTKIKGIPLLADKRKLDRLTSEPVMLYGMELGFDKKMGELAWQVLGLQAQRFKETGQLTIVSEDAVAIAPYYFYYYCVYCSGKPFIINVHSPGKELNEPRWISTKAAFAWHALLPSQYTWDALQAVQPAYDETQGWTTGVYEKTGKPTGTLALNTAAVILEAALYRKTGQPFLQGAR